MIKKYTYVVLITLISTHTFNAQGITTRTINISGKQRMLSQRLAKNYILNLQNETFDNFKTKLESDEISFTRQLDNLYSAATGNQQILEKLNIEKRDWLLLSNALKTKAYNNSKKILTVLEYSDILLTSSNNVVKEFELALGNNSRKGEIVNLAGRQRMLSQRLCVYYASLYYYNTSDKIIRSDKRKIQFQVENIFNEMDNAINQFYSSEFTTDHIESQVVNIALVFEKLKSKKELILSGHISLEEVYKITNKLLFENNLLTKMYAE